MNSLIKTLMSLCLGVFWLRWQGDYKFSSFTMHTPTTTKFNFILLARVLKILCCLLNFSISETLFFQMVMVLLVQLIGLRKA